MRQVLGACLPEAPVSFGCVSDGVQYVYTCKIGIFSAFLNVTVLLRNVIVTGEATVDS